MAAKWAQQEVRSSDAAGRLVFGTAPLLIAGAAQVKLSAKRRGCHLVTNEVRAGWPLHT
jgi:hypothetical protein